MENIRNFAIIAHIDHGKSTLADRFLELTGTVDKDKHQEQLLDRNPISRERGITIKLAPVRMTYKNQKPENRNPKQIQNTKSKNQNNFEFRASNFEFSNSEYILNLIDTPGHVDFSYEVDRTLVCVEGVILLVDATQGVQAQTIANAYKAIEKNLVIIPSINKIDLPDAEVAKSKRQLVEFLGVKESEIFEISAKTGENVERLLSAVVEKIPHPQNPQGSLNLRNPEGSFVNIETWSASSLQALIFDSYYDQHRGVIAFVRIFSGKFRPGMTVQLASGRINLVIQEVGYFLPDLQSASELGTGEIGYIVSNLKDIHQVRVGDTIIDEAGMSFPLVGYKKVNPMVYASVFPTDTDDFLNLKKALEKLYLTDSALDFSTIHSKALGTGYRVGFLGLLHADVVRERLEREFNLSLVLTPPQIDYQRSTGRHNDGKVRYKEPIVKVSIITPQEYVGTVMNLCQSFKAKFITMDNKSQVALIYEMPLSEMISDFYNKLKSVSSGYASLDWEFLEYREVEADKLTLLLNHEPVEEFSEVVVADRAFEKAQNLVARLKDLIPRQQYEVKIQAQYKGKIIASERVAPFRKDVTKKLYGGDRTRKDKLLEKQKKGKKKMKMIGKVEIPKEAFLKLFNKN
ncbi:elongation factor 4 [Candidatus Roizmanbacteria bacterium RIFCSPHIGHO2_01_FULL_39_12c]|uniref:Elongation factor 4 n=1 Tax=Candidatus Roizmanbacteria bacterium RIFCSPHIGHO2_01_FULL_39_12c TaxID=1802031 RepID=A0A1F7GBT7_9BACT|nr:MAG: elongation factor 4 [Candidatus Roizmanbacteria bacterium RIFCSPHIGHO2_01_FULL_39_12c]OGK47431.1 MAG: elongation factor 4 [Candidatus Roizmanbacteria bacterium RIFCSPLOWO2_01_FULL_40_13]